MLVVDDNQYMRKLIRNLLVNCGVKDIYEAPDGIAALDSIRTFAPDMVILDWEMPLLSGAELVRIVELLEEFRRNNPHIHDRVDQQAEAMAQPSDPQQMLDAIKEIRAEAAQLSGAAGGAEGKARAAANGEKAIESIRSGAWLRSWEAKVLALIAFGILAIVLFWQGLQKPPKEDASNTLPPPDLPGAYTA